MVPELLGILKSVPAGNKMDPESREPKAAVWKKEPVPTVNSVPPMMLAPSFKMMTLPALAIRMPAVLGKVVLPRVSTPVLVPSPAWMMPVLVTPLRAATRSVLLPRAVMVPWLIKA